MNARRNRVSDKTSTLESVQWATQRIEDFCAIHDKDSLSDAVEILKQSQSFTDEIHDHLNVWSSINNLDNSAYCLGALTVFMAMAFDG